MKTIRSITIGTLLLSQAIAGEFTTKNHIKGRGLNLSFTLPDGLKNFPVDSYVGVWGGETEGVTVVVTLSMRKHHLHSQHEKISELEANGKHPFHALVSNRNLKVGNEPALLTIYRTPAEEPDDETYSLLLALWLHPGDTSVCLRCEISPQGASKTKMDEAVAVLKPLLIKMFESVELDE